MEIVDKEFLVATAQEKISQGSELIEQLNVYKQVPGTQKIQRKINQEIKFLKKVRQENSGQCPFKMLSAPNPQVQRAIHANSSC